MLFLSGMMFLFNLISDVGATTVAVTVPEKVVFPFFNITRASLNALDDVPFPITNKRSAELNEIVEVGV